MKASKIKWDERYRAKSGKPHPLPEPPAFLKHHWPNFKTGSVLDLASGDGAVSLFMAERGFKITAVDISDVGLYRLQELLESKGYVSDVIEIDLEEESVDLSRIGSIDNIAISRYKPVPELWPELISILKPGGYLLIATFNLDHHKKTKFPVRFCLESEEFIDRFPELELVVHDVNGAAFGMDGYLFRKQSY